MVDEVLAGAPLLSFVGRRSEAKRAAEQLAVDVRVVGRDLCEQLFDKALISLVKLDNGHESVYSGQFRAPSRGGNGVVTGK